MTVTSVRPTPIATIPKQHKNNYGGAFLWGSHSLDDIAIDTQPATDANTYVYTPGDSCNVIQAYDGIHVLWLSNIQSHEVSLRPTRHGKVQVHYNNQPILRMAGVNLIYTEDGCFPMNHWLQNH